MGMFLPELAEGLMGGGEAAAAGGGATAEGTSSGGFLSGPTAKGMGMGAMMERALGGGSQVTVNNQQQAPMPEVGTVGSIKQNWNHEKFASILEEERYHLAQADLSDCPECSDKLIEKNGEKICVGCGHRQPIITQALAKEAADAQPDWMAQMMQNAMAGQNPVTQNLQTDVPVDPGVPGALGDPNNAMSVAQLPIEQPVTAKTAAGFPSGEDEIGMANKNRGDNTNPDIAGQGSGFMKQVGDGPEQLKDVSDDGAAGKSTDVADALGEQHGGDSDLATQATNAFHQNLPLITEFAMSDKPGSEHPILRALDEMLESAFPGYKDAEKGDTTVTGVEPHDPDNPTEQLEEILGQDLDDDDEVGGKEQDPENVNVKDFAREAGVGMWGFADGDQVRSLHSGETGVVAELPLEGIEIHWSDGTSDFFEEDPRQDIERIVDPRLAGVASTGNWKESIWHIADVAPVMQQPGMAVGTQPAPAPTTSIPTCSMCQQSHAPGTPCPMNPPNMMNHQNQMIQQPLTPPRPQAVVTHTAADEGLGQDLDQQSRQHSDEGHDQRYEDGDDYGDWYEDWPGPDKDQHPWVDDKGQPLTEGQEYEMHGSDYAIPDKITVESVTPNKLTFVLHSGDLDYRDSVTPEDVANTGYTFSAPAQGTDSESGFGLEDKNPQRAPLELEHPIRPGQDAAPQTTDLSIPPTKQGAAPFGRKRPEVAQIVDEFEKLDATPKFAGDSPDSRAHLLDGHGNHGVDVDPQMMAKFAGKDFSPSEQRAFIDEAPDGGARNQGSLDLTGTHYELDEDYGDSLW